MLGRALFETLAGRAILVGLAVKVLLLPLGAGPGRAQVLLTVADTLAGLTIAAGAAYFVVRLLLVAKRRLLWRVRRKLILSYIFIGLVPALLIAVFFLLAGLLLFFNLSAYLVQTRLASIADRARSLAESAALEIQHADGRDVRDIIGRKQAAAEAEYPAVSIAMVPVERPCAETGPGVETRSSSAVGPIAAGPWTPVARPDALPRWIGCLGMAELLLAAERRPAEGPSGDTGEPKDSRPPSADLVVRAVAFPDVPRPGYAVVADIPVGVAIRRRLRSETGVEMTSVSVAPAGDADDGGLAADRGGPGPASARLDGVAGAGPLNGVAFLEYRDWTTGRTGMLLASTALNVGEIYEHISAAQGPQGKGSFGHALLVVLLVVVGGLFLVIEAVALVAGLALARSITGSVHELVAGTERVRRGDFAQRIAVKAKDQLGELAESFNSMTASIEDLLRHAAEKKRLEEELRIARDIQMSLLPQGPLVLPGLSVTALCVPAREVGGDYYDFLPLGERRVAILIADVAGKGTSAALYMAELKGLVLSLSQIYASPRELLVAANRIIARTVDFRSFITMTYAVVDLEAGTMRYARAGHTPLMYLPGPGGDSRRVRVLAPDGLVLGLKLDDGSLFEQLLVEETLALYPGDLYLLFTDGITEAMNAADDCFGEQRLCQLIEAHGDLPTDELRERVLREVQAFVGAAPQHDDITLIVLKIDERQASVSTAVTYEPAAIAG